ncbi:MAG TPA: glycogen debranching protein [Phycisphaerales bacterium]|nr:glycogen debranching protein [Phycisphaerales bacterium]
MSRESKDSPLPPIVVSGGEGELESLLGREWLIANRLGAYASSSAAGCNTRRYHGLLVAATKPPVGRVTALSTVMEVLSLDDADYALATNEFAGTFSPRGVVHLVEFRNDAAPTFVFRCGPATLTKEILLADRANAVAVRYTLRGASGELRVRPFAALRDYHHLRRADGGGQMTFEVRDGAVAVQDRAAGGEPLLCAATDAEFQADPQWWYRFLYRVDILRGQDGIEDLYSPGQFVYRLIDGQTCQFNASLGPPVRIGFQTTLESRRRRLGELAASVAGWGDETARRLAAASDALVVRRNFPGDKSSATILAGYHWFADWGRDTFIALPGVLLATGRFDQAREVFRTFTAALSEGMLPNRFDDYTSAAHYNSIDASLWFVIAAERYLAATGDARFWRDELLPAAHAVLTAYREGTRFDIHADADGLLLGGSHQTQLTWMDAKLGDEVVTPRHGKAVEVNALWHSAHRILAERCRGADDRLADHYAQLAETIAPAFVRAFWDEPRGCLYDCVGPNGPDGSVRPNQIFAVSLPHSPLSAAQRHAVVATVARELLTPVGLRSLSPHDGRYRRRYGGSWESRDRAYHQGTVWAWLIGAFIEAHLKVAGDRPLAVAQAKEYLAAFDDHLRQAGLGFVSEIFDGDPPHAPRGCICQAWSIGEVLRAKQLVAQAEKT